MSGSRVRLGKLRTLENEGFSFGPVSYPPSLSPPPPPSSSSSSLLAHQSLLTADFWLHTSRGSRRGGERVASHQKAPARTTLSFMLLDRDRVVRDGPRLALN